jgi:hypothetical protein
MKIIVRFLKFAFIVFLGVSLSYLLVSCRGETVSEPEEVSVDIMPILPEVTISGTDYTQATLPEAFPNNELSSRFTKYYGPVYTASLKESLAGLVSITIDGMGEDGAGFTACLNSIENIKDKNYLPCAVKSAKYEGKEAWIIELNWGTSQNGLGNTAYCAVEKSSQKVLYWENCN